MQLSRAMIWPGHAQRLRISMAPRNFFKGRLIAIGGNEDRVNELNVLRRVVHETGKNDFKVAVVTTASEEPEQRGEEYQRAFSSLGASRIELLDIRQRTGANDKDNVRMLEDTDLVFLTGGDQLRLTTVLGGTAVLDAIHRLLIRGTLIAGTSAGAAVFSDTMIYEGKSEEGLIKGSVLTTSGFGFVENVIFDTHFLDRGRIGRLMQIVTTNPTCIGVGIGEGSGVILEGNSSFEVIGTGQVVIVDGRDIGHSNVMSIEPGGPIAVENVRVHSLVDGYGYDLAQRKFLTPQALATMNAQ